VRGSAAGIGEEGERTVELGLAGKAVVVPGGSKGIGLVWTSAEDGVHTIAAASALYAVYVGTRGAQRP